MIKKIRVISALLPLNVGCAIYITDQLKDVKRIAKMNIKNNEVAIRVFIENGIAIFWNADIFLHQDIINRTKDFDEAVLKKFALSKNLDLSTWHRGIIFFKGGIENLTVEAIDPRTKASEEELFKFLNKDGDEG